MKYKIGFTVMSLSEFTIIHISIGFFSSTGKRNIWEFLEE